MEYNKREIDVLKDTLEQVPSLVVELSESQLALIGGGAGEVSPY